jgi:sugar phosphate isomerase/epimerase
LPTRESSSGTRARKCRESLELARFAAELTAKGFDGLVSVEVISTELTRPGVEPYARDTFVAARRVF